MPAERHPPDPAVPRFARHGPGVALAPWVECYWSLTAEQAPSWRTRVLPDGSNDVIVDLVGARTFVVGAMRRAALVPLEGRVELLGVRFRPGSALPFLEVPLSALADRQVDLDAVWGRAAGSMMDALAGTPTADRVARFERFLRARRRREYEEDALAGRAVALLRRTRGGIGVGVVAAALGVGERRLQRAFERSVGLSPKRLARVLRFQYAVRVIGRSGARPGAALALDAGYADQAHFIREFRSLAGVTPARFALERGVGFVQDADPPATEIGRHPNQEEP